MKIFNNEDREHSIQNVEKGPAFETEIQQWKQKEILGTICYWFHKTCKSIDLWILESM